MSFSACALAMHASPAYATRPVVKALPTHVIFFTTFAMIAVKLARPGLDRLRRFRQLAEDFAHALHARVHLRVLLVDAQAILAG